jgi:hypothetical protein
VNLEDLVTTLRGALRERSGRGDHSERVLNRLPEVGGRRL